MNISGLLNVKRSTKTLKKGCLRIGYVDHALATI